MKSKSGYQQAVIVLLALALAQLACNAGAQGSSGGSQPTAASIVQPATQSSDAGVQATAGSGSEATQPAPAPSSDRGTPDEAKAMLAKAVEHYKSVGRDQALADFNGKVAPFFDRDLYVVCLDASHVETANGGFPQYVGTSADLLQTVDGNPLGKAIWDAAASNPEGSVDYHWTNPVNGQTEPKTLFFENLGTDVCGVGAYNP
jgi:hypothetical protein